MHCGREYAQRQTRKDEKNELGSISVCLAPGRREEMTRELHFLKLTRSLVSFLYNLNLLTFPALPCLCLWLSMPYDSWCSVWGALTSIQSHKLAKCQMVEEKLIEIGLIESPMKCWCQSSFSLTALLPLRLMIIKCQRKYLFRPSVMQNLVISNVIRIYELKWVDWLRKN